MLVLGNGQRQKLHASLTAALAHKRVVLLAVIQPEGGIFDPFVSCTKARFVLGHLPLHFLADTDLGQTVSPALRTSGRQRTNRLPPRPARSRAGHGPPPR